MPTKKDPLASVISYFTTVELAQLAQTLVVVKEIARSRLTPTTVGRKPSHRRATTGSTPGGLLAPKES
jgi:hypothetical protein